MPTATQPELKEFYSSGHQDDSKRYDDLAIGLEKCKAKGYKPLYMPAVIDARIADASFFRKWFTTPSIRATGRTKPGSGVVVYVHIPNYFSNPANIRKAIAQGLVNYAGKMPQAEFERLVKLAEKGAKGVHIVPAEILKKAVSGRVPLEQALEHPQTVPFCDGRERAEKYLPKFGEAYNTKTIGIWHSDDLPENGSDYALARLLYVGGNVSGLVGYGLGGFARFLGVRSSVSSEAANLQTPREFTYPQIMRMVKDLVPKRNHGRLEARLKRRF